MPLPFLHKEETLEELQEKNERLDVELTVAQKEAAKARLKQAGLTGKSFNWDWSRIWKWVRGG